MRHRRRRVVLDSASYEIGQFVQPVGTGPGGMVGRGRETLPGGSGQAARSRTAAMPTRAWGSSRLSRRRCSHLAAGEPAQCPGVGGEVQDHGGTDGLADAGGDVVRPQEAAHYHVIPCQPWRVIPAITLDAVNGVRVGRPTRGPAGARVLQQNAPGFVFWGLTGLGTGNHVWLKALYRKSWGRSFGQRAILSKQCNGSRAAG